MPTMANIVVKKADGTTDITWTALTPSAGDGSSARWRSNSVSTVLGFRPTLEVRTRSNGANDGRRLVATGKFPVIQTVNSVDVISAIVPFEFSILVPQMADSVQVQEAVHQFANLLASGLLKTSAVDGYAPT